MKAVERLVMIVTGTVLLLMSFVMWAIMPHWSVVVTGVCSLFLLAIGLFYPKF